MAPSVQIICGDSREVLKTLPDESVHCVVTSPPYWGLRDYGVVGQIGLEKSLGEFLDRLVGVFREVRRVLRKDGTLWVNMGDSYADSGRGGNPGKSAHVKQRSNEGSLSVRNKRSSPKSTGLKSKDLIGVPWRLALALQADGWYLRSDIIWHKPNPMPESIADRPTTSHEHLFLLARSERYFYDAEAITEPCSENTHLRVSQDVASQAGSLRANGGSRADRPMKTVLRGGISPKMGAAPNLVKANSSMAEAIAGHVLVRNKRTVWTVPTKGFKGAHFATFPPDLIKPCIMAGSRPGDVVLDPFGGSGTTGEVSLGLGRSAILIELNPEYIALAQERITSAPLGLGI